MKDTHCRCLVARREMHCEILSTNLHDDELTTDLAFVIAVCTTEAKVFLQGIHFVSHILLLLTHDGCFRFLPPSTSLIGYARSKLSDQNVRDKVKPFLRDEQKVVQDFLSLITYVPGSYDGPEDFQHLNEELKKREQKGKGACGRLFYLALPPSVYPQVGLLSELVRLVTYYFAPHVEPPMRTMSAIWMCSSLCQLSLLIQDLDHCKLYPTLDALELKWQGQYRLKPSTISHTWHI